MKEVEYYKDVEEVVTDRIINTKTVQVLEPNTIAVNKDEINTNDKYEHYVFDKLILNDGTQETEIDDIPDTLNNNDIIKVFYKKASKSNSKLYRQRYRRNTRY